MDPRKAQYYILHLLGWFFSKPAAQDLWSKHFVSPEEAGVWFGESPVKLILHVNQCKECQSAPDTVVLQMSFGSLALGIICAMEALPASWLWWHWNSLKLTAWLTECSWDFIWILTREKKKTMGGGEKLFYSVCSFYYSSLHMLRLFLSLSFQCP